MSYFAPYLDETGIHIPTYTDRMDELVTGYKQIFGEDVYLGEDTQDYELMSLFAKAMDDVTQLMLDVYSARNPDWASSTALDALLPLAGISRYGATYSTVTLELIGLPGATLPAGVLARDIMEHSWRTLAPVEFDSNGKATVDAECTVAGSIAASAGTITTIETPAYSWYTVNNPADATMGRDIETDAAVRVRRAQSVALHGRGTVDSIHAALINIEGVEHVSVFENYTNETDENGLPPHSVCALVTGGDDQAIAATVYLKKAPGIATYGLSSAIYTDVYGRDNVVRFSRPDNVTATINLQVRALYGWDNDYMVATIKSYIIAYVNSIAIGEDLVVSALWGEAFKATSGTGSPAFSVLSITASANGSEPTSDTLEAAYNTKFMADAEHVQITVVSGG